MHDLKKSSTDLMSWSNLNKDSKQEDEKNHYIYI